MNHIDTDKINTKEIFESLRIGFKFHIYDLYTLNKDQFASSSELAMFHKEKHILFSTIELIKDLIENLVYYRRAFQQKKNQYDDLLKAIEAYGDKEDSSLKAYMEISDIISKNKHDEKYRT